MTVPSRLVILVGKPSSLIGMTMPGDCRYSVVAPGSSTITLRACTVRGLYDCVSLGDMLVVSITSTHLLHQVDNLATCDSWLEGLERSRSAEIQLFAFIPRRLYQIDIDLDAGAHSDNR